MVDIVQITQDIANYKTINSKLTDNSAFIQFLWNSYHRFNIDVQKCKEFLSLLNLEDIYSVIDNMNVFVLTSPTSQLYYFSGSTIQTHSIMVQEQKFNLIDLKDFIQKNSYDTFFLYQIVWNNNKTEHFIRYKQIKMDYETIVSLPRGRRLLWIRKLKLNKLSEIANEN